MIYIHFANGCQLVILEPGNIRRLKEGKPLYSPGHEICIGYSPDIEWTANALQAALDNGETDIAAIMQESMKLEEVDRGDNAPLRRIL